MPRSARIDIPNLLQHVIVRGIEKRDIFMDDDDRLGFVKRLSDLLIATETDCFAWALRAGLVKTLDELDRYAWCGHAVLLGGGDLLGQATAEVLARFG